MWMCSVYTKGFEMLEKIRRDAAKSWMRDRLDIGP